ncbi:MAG: DUF2752 domain-containing protein [Acidimicrobiia bacterium]
MRLAPVVRAARPDRTRAASLAAGAVAACAVLAVADPADGGLYPRCPTQVLLGADCPACGTLRGLHSLSRGRLAEALDHNLLLLVAVPVGALVWLALVGQALGRPVRVPAPPGWAVPALVIVAVAFTVARNVGLGGLAWLDSAA